MKCVCGAFCYCLKGKLSPEVLKNLTYYITVNIPISVVSLF